MPFATEFSEEEQQRHNPNNLSQRRALNHLPFHARSGTPENTASNETPPPK